MRRKTTSRKPTQAHQNASFRSASLLGAILGVVLLLVPSVIILPL